MVKLETEQNKIDRINNFEAEEIPNEDIAELEEFVKKDGNVIQKCRGCVHLKKFHCIWPEHVEVPSLPSDPACGHFESKVNLVTVAEKILGVSLKEEEKK